MSVALVERPSPVELVETRPVHARMLGGIPVAEYLIARRPLPA